MYQVRTETRTSGDRTGPVVTLEGPAGSRLEIWTARGFNCLRWAVGSGREALHAMPDWDANPVPTRSGTPILAPFPNRIREGRFSWYGKDYQLPLNDSTKSNAIHGEAPRHAWRIVDSGFDAKSAWVTGAFRPSLDAPGAVQNWVGDYELRATWRLVGSDALFNFSFKNLSQTPLPFGLGLHPYFRFPDAPTGELIDGCMLEVPAKKLWELVESLPTGKRPQVPDEIDYQSPKAIGNTIIDHLYTALTGIPDANRQKLHGRLTHPTAPGSIEVWASEIFREIVLFTPVHRQAVCIEPYTCASDAVNLWAKNLDAGLIKVGVAQSVDGRVEFRWNTGRTA